MKRPPEPPIVMPPPSPSDVNGQPANDLKTESPILTALALQTTLRGALAHTGELIHSLKRQQRQSKLVIATLTSLKELQKVAG